MHYFFWFASVCNSVLQCEFYVNIQGMSMLGKVEVLWDCIRIRSIWSMIVCSFHITYAFHSESTLYSCLNVKELLAWNRRKIWSLSDCNWTRTHNHLVRKRTLDHLAKLASLAKWLSVHLRTKWLSVWV